MSFKPRLSQAALVARCASPWLSSENCTCTHRVDVSQPHHILGCFCSVWR